MKEQQSKLQVGVWMDHHQALLITEVNGEFAVREKLHADHHRGDHSEHTTHNTEQRDSRKYYKALGQALTGYDEIFLFGPGKSQEELRNFLHEDQHFKGKQIALGSVDHLTDHQVIAKVREYFSR
jgi:stalled ribosome rescue protein Dom34